MRPWHADEIALVTDLYELTMAQAYLQASKAQETATFSLFVRQYPPHRGYFVAACPPRSIGYGVRGTPS